MIVGKPIEALPHFGTSIETLPFRPLQKTEDDTASSTNATNLWGECKGSFQEPIVGGT